MTKGKVNWEWVNEWKKDPNPLGGHEEFQCIWIPYGLPEIVDPVETKYGIGVEVQPNHRVLIHYNRCPYHRRCQEHRDISRCHYQHNLYCLRHIPVVVRRLLD